MNRIKRYLLFAGLFFLMFPPHILIGGFILKTYFLFIVLPGLIGGLIFILKRKGTIVEKNTISLLMMALAYFILLSGIGLFKDISVVSQTMLGFVILFACWLYVNMYRKKYGEQYVSQLLLDLNKACVINSIFVILTFLSPGFKHLLYSFIGITETSRRYLFGDVSVARFQGIVPSGFSFLSTTHALLLVAGIWGFYINKKKYNMFGIIWFAICQIIIFGAILLIGRTGLIIVLLFTFALIFYRLKFIVQTLRIFKKSVLLIMTILVISITILVSINFTKFKKNIDFAFELVISYTQKGKLDRSTTEVLTHQLIFPKKTFELIFGTGNFGRSKSLPYVYSDVGYVLFITGAGIVGMLIGFSFYIAGLYYSYKYRALNPYLSWYITVFFVALLILNLKDYYYISQVGYSQVFFIMICILGKEVERKKFINSGELTNQLNSYDK
jgi:hypothetical protein